MKYCPKCRYRYKDNLETCRKCKVKLVNPEDLKPYCKVCKREFDYDTKFCPDCLVELDKPVSEKANFGYAEYIEMITVYETSNLAEVSLIKGLLEGAGIHNNARGENVQNLFVLGLTGGVNPLTGPVKIDVQKDRAEEASNIISEALGL